MTAVAAAMLYQRTVLELRPEVALPLVAKPRPVLELHSMPERLVPHFSTLGLRVPAAAHSHPLLALAVPARLSRLWAPPGSAGLQSSRGALG